MSLGTTGAGAVDKKAKDIDIELEEVSPLEAGLRRRPMQEYGSPTREDAVITDGASPESGDKVITFGINPSRDGAGPDKPWKCEFCSAAFETFEACAAHEQHEHPDRVNAGSFSGVVVPERDTDRDDDEDDSLGDDDIEGGRQSMRQSPPGRRERRRDLDWRVKLKQASERYKDEIVDL